METILDAACPSQRGGIAPFFQLPDKSFSMAGEIDSGLMPSKTFVPIETVSGRSVFALSVIQGIPKTVVSSVIPPESVITALANCTK